MDDPKEAWYHLQANNDIIVSYGSSFEGKTLHTWDDGERILFQCRDCGVFFLWQDSEFHSFSDDDDRYYSDYFPVEGLEDAQRLNRELDGFEIERRFPGRYLVQDNDSAPHWKYGDST